MKPRLPWMLIAAIVAGALLAACPGSRSDGLDRSTIPAAVQDDYDVFALRCSKCHSLSRPLDSGIDDDEYWKAYVSRMRHMPASGISAEDEQIILRFLRWFSADLRAKKKAKEEGTGG
jgi:hypothetical protein